MAKNIKSTIPAGQCWIYGRKPGTPQPYTGPASRDFRMWMYAYETTEEAIQQVLPEPLEMAEQPPIVIAWAGNANHWRALDGNRHSYCEVAWWIPCQYKGLKGLNCVWLYIDSPSGDPSDGGFLGAAYREINGFPKKVAPVKMIGDGRDCRAIAYCRGTKLIDIKFKFTEEVNSPPEFYNEYFENQIFVKEIPNCDFSGYDVRKVIGMKSIDPVIHKITVGKASIELGHLDSDPVDVLEVINPGKAVEIQSDFTEFKIWEVDDLLK